MFNTRKQPFIFNLHIKEMLIMKYKKIMLIALLLLAVLTIGAVSASDDVASDGSMAAGEEGVDESPVSEATSDGEVLADSPYEENGFDPIVAKTIELDNDEDAVVDINTPDEGNFTIYGRKAILPGTWMTWTLLKRAFIYCPLDISMTPDPFGYLKIIS